MKWFIMTFLFAQSLIAEPLMIEGAWIRLLPPGAKVTAAFMTLKNSTSEAQKITAVKSEHFGSIELHETKMEKGVMIMSKLDDLTVPAQGELVLKPKGLHLMLFESKSVWKEGDKMDLHLHFADGKTQKVTLEVRKGEEEKSSHHHHHHHN